MTILSVYSPTAKAPPSIKQKFSQDLQATLSLVPPRDILVLLGDFNARVGKRDHSSCLWEETLGLYGLDERNDAGEEFLELCATNNLTIMNTWFQKKDLHLGTWMHPATKRHHMIDFVVMRTSQRSLCSDVQVMRGANCWSDHHMLRAKLTLKLNQPKPSKRRPIPFAIHRFGDHRTRELFSDSLTSTLIKSPTDPSEQSSTKWNTLKTCILETAKETIGRERKSQPDWFLESAPAITPLIEAKNRAYERLLQSNSPANRQEFRQQQRRVKNAINNAKDEWIRKVALEGEGTNRDGKTRWKCIRKLQTLHRGRRPVQTTSVLKENGELANDPDEINSRWHRHFTTILNVASQFSEETIASLEPRPTLWDLDEPPTEEEFQTAMDRLKTGKAAGMTGILQEMIVYGGHELWDRLLDLMKRVWEEGRVVEDWKNAEIVPIPKKGNMKVCDNWRGINLLDVVGKLFARIVQERLQTLAENILPESQCGFRSSRGCIDMIFVARQLVEKACRAQPISIFIVH